MTLYDIMYEAIVDQYMNGEITLEQANELNDLAFDRYTTEKKTTADYRIQKFKKEFKYDPKDRSIEVNGERIPFNLKANTSKKYSAHEDISHYKNDDDHTDKGIITMNRRAFNHKHPDTHKAIVGHEYGHSVAHRMNPEEKEKELKKYTPHTNKVKKEYLDIDMRNARRQMNPRQKKTDMYDVADREANKKYIEDESGIENFKIDYNSFGGHDASEEEYYADDWGKKIAGKKAIKHMLKDTKRDSHKEIKRNKYEDNYEYTDPEDGFKTKPGIKLQNTAQKIKDIKDRLSEPSENRSSSETRMLKDSLNDYKAKRAENRKELKWVRKNYVPVERSNHNRMTQVGMNERIKNVSNDKKDN